MKSKILFLTALILMGTDVRADFAAGTKIYMDDGSLKTIEEIRAGDRVRHPEKDRWAAVTQRVTQKESAPLVRFGWDGVCLTTTSRQPVLTDNGFKTAGKLAVGDHVYDAKMVQHALSTVETLPPQRDQKVFNLVLKSASENLRERLLAADGIVSGDLVVQNIVGGRE